MAAFSNSRMRRVTANSASRSISNRESGTQNTNTGATGAIVLTLPASYPGLHFRFAVEVAQSLTIAVQTGDTMALPSTGVQGSTSKGLVCNAVNGTLHVECDTAGKWNVCSYTGTWTAQP